MTFGVVIVTYNRLDKLKKCLAAYEKQQYLPSVVLVINNCSTDGTGEYLQEWLGEGQNTPFRKQVIQMPENIGGAGGFAEGIRYMQDQDVDWIWIADDDAYPEEDCLLTIADYYQNLNENAKEEIVSLCAKVVDSDGRVSGLHRRKVYRTSLCVKEAILSSEEMNANSISIDMFSFVGIAVKKSAVQESGLPQSEFFIYYDDTEYALRLGKMGKHIFLSEAVVVHDSPENVITKKNWKNYYMYRNKLYIYRKYYSKRYYFVELLRTFYMTAVHFNCKVSWKQLFQAIHDAKQGELGKNENYLPGKILE